MVKTARRKKHSTRGTAITSAKRSVRRRKKPVVVAVSGGFDPVHAGHVRLFEYARSLGDKLIVILNNDNWLRKKKRHVFMPQEERKAIIGALRAVDGVVVTSHPPNPEDVSVCAELLRIKPHIFANGGDRTRENIPEVPICEAIGCKMVFNVGAGGKIQSSSWLLANYVKQAAAEGPFPAEGKRVVREA